MFAPAATSTRDPRDARCGPSGGLAGPDAVRDKAACLDDADVQEVAAAWDRLLDKVIRRGKGGVPFAQVVESLIPPPPPPPILRAAPRQAAEDRYVGQGELLAMWKSPIPDLPHLPPTAPSPPAFAGAVQYRLRGRPVGPSKPPYHRKRRMVPLCCFVPATPTAPAPPAANAKPPANTNPKPKPKAKAKAKSTTKFKATDKAKRRAKPTPKARLAATATATAKARAHRGAAAVQERLRLQRACQAMAVRCMEGTPGRWEAPPAKCLHARALGSLRGVTLHCGAAVAWFLRQPLASLPALLDVLLARATALSPVQARCLLCSGVLDRECGWQKERLDTALLEHVATFFDQFCKLTESTAPHMAIVARELVAHFWRDPVPVPEALNSGVHYVMHRLAGHPAWLHCLQLSLKQRLGVFRRPEDQQVALVANTMRVAALAGQFRSFASSVILDHCFGFDRELGGGAQRMTAEWQTALRRLLDKVLCRFFEFILDLHRRSHDLQAAMQDLLKRFERNFENRRLAATPHLLFAVASLQPCLAPAVLQFFHEKAFGEQLPPAHRQIAVLYAGGFAAHFREAEFLKAARPLLVAMAEWAAAYVQREAAGPPSPLPRWKAHPLFYNVVQALLHALASQGPFLMRDPSCVTDFQLPALLRSRLEPLLYIHVEVTTRFCAEADALCQRRMIELPHNEVLAAHMTGTLQDRSSFFARRQESNAELHEQLGLWFFPFGASGLEEFDRYISGTYYNAQTFGYGAQNAHERLFTVKAAEPAAPAPPPPRTREEIILRRTPSTGPRPLP